MRDSWRLHGFTKPYFVCAVLSLAAIWLHRYPPGIDLPQHANLFQVLSRYDDPALSYRFFYRIDFFTPYAVLYLLAWPLTKLGGALFASKALLSLAVLAMPIALHRWLKAIGGHTSLSVLGFVVAFGFAYHWGFLSFMLATPVSLLYLAAVEELRKEHTWKRVAIGAGLAVLLFFSHGVTFGITMLSAGFACLLQRNLRTVAFELSHFVPVGAIMVSWRLLHHEPAEHAFEEWPTAGRLSTLFSGSFAAHATYLPAIAGFVVAVVLFVVGKPAVSRSPTRWLPFALSLAGLCFLPEWVGDAWLIGSRCVQLVHTFAVGAFDFQVEGRRLRWLARAAIGIAVASLLALNYRLYVYNRELAGLDKIMESIPHGTDLKLYPGDDGSEAFGEGELGQVVAWITAARGGLMENDSARYFQMPILRRDVEWPAFRHFVVRAPPKKARAQVGKDAELVTAQAKFREFEAHAPSLDLPGATLVRYSQTWGTLESNLSVGKSPLTVAGQEYERGIGTHARSVIELRLEDGIRRIRGLVGMDDGGAAERARGVFRLLDVRRKELWSSGPMAPGGRALAFEVSVENLRGDLFLVVDGVGDINGAHADWLDVEMRR